MLPTHYAGKTEIKCLENKATILALKKMFLPLTKLKVQFPIFGKCVYGRSTRSCSPFETRVIFNVSNEALTTLKANGLTGLILNNWGKKAEI